MTSILNRIFLKCGTAFFFSLKDIWIVLSLKHYRTVKTGRFGFGAVIILDHSIHFHASIHVSHTKKALNKSSKIKHIDGLIPFTKHHAQHVPEAQTSGFLCNQIQICSGVDYLFNQSNPDSLKCQPIRSRFRACFSRPLRHIVTEL